MKLFVDLRFFVLLALSMGVVFVGIRSVSPTVAEAAKSHEDSFLLDEEALKFAESAFQEKCALCHPKEEEAPNERMDLFDGVWNHGGELEDIQKTISEGVADTIMMPQKNVFSETEIGYLAKYVKLLERQKKESETQPVEGAENPQRKSP